MPRQLFEVASLQRFCMFEGFTESIQRVVLLLQRVHRNTHSWSVQFRQRFPLPKQSPQAAAKRFSAENSPVLRSRSQSLWMDCCKISQGEYLPQTENVSHSSSQKYAFDPFSRPGSMFSGQCHWLSLRSRNPAIAKKESTGKIQKVHSLF